MRRSLTLIGAVAVLAACSGGGHKSIPPANPKATAEAARACRMWAETVARFTPSTGTPNYALLDAMATAIGPVANQASTDDQRWAALALDIAGATDFQSAAMPDVNQRILGDCKAVAATANKAAAAEPDPFSTTTTSAPSSTTVAP